MKQFMVLYWWYDTVRNVMYQGVEFFDSLADARMCVYAIKSVGNEAELYMWRSNNANTEYCGYYSFCNE